MADPSDSKEADAGAGKMHADEVHIDVSLVRRLLRTQFPRWVDLPLELVSSAGTDNAIFRLGDDMVVRLPRLERATTQVDKEQRWLPRLAPQLPLAIPLPLAKGSPAGDYPWRWSVYSWLKGQDATIERIADLPQAAAVLGRFVAGLRRIDPTGGPVPGEHNSSRGAPLATRDASVRAAITSLNDMFDAHEVTAAWEVALDTPAWQRQPVWIHGDLLPTNLLIERSQLTAVIDFGCLGVGDPACDLMAAWTLFSGDSREAFRAALPIDDATWARGRGWALSWALIFIPYYLRTNPVGVDVARHTITEILADHRYAG